MNKLIFKKILSDYLNFFIIAITIASLIVWVFQSVNFLDIIIEDGRSYLTYINYSLLNIPKIISKLMPFVLFFSFFFILNKYENNNELLIFWNFGVNKIKLVYFFFYFSLIIVVLQIFLSSIIVPNSLQFSRSIITNSNINLFEGFIKPKRFNDTIKNLTIYSESKKENGDLVNIFLKKDTDLDFQITYAKIGRIKTGNNDILELYDGQTINYVNKKISTFNFQKSDFGLNNLKSSFIEVNKIQETKTIVLLSCLNSQFNTNLYLLNNINSSNFTHNCKYENTDDIIKELYKRFLIPLYIPVLFLTTLTLILSSKENKNYSSRKIIIFIINFFLIVFSETTLKFVGKSIFENYLIFSIPIILIIFLLINFIYHFNFRYNKVFLK
jgi:lipopolysaccharide export system permease protein